MVDLKTELAAIVRKENVQDAPGTLESYSSDQSFASAMPPQLVVKAGSADEVHKIVVWANRTKTPLIPVSSGPPHFHGDTVPGVPGAVIVDLSGMKQISKIDRRNRVAIIEPGVTYGELQAALARENLRVSVPLMPRANKSVLASLLEKEPRLNCRYQWSSLDPLRCLEVVWGDGNRFWSGSIGNDVMDLDKQWDTQKRPLDPYGPGQTDFYRLLSASQGSIGIATWASLRCEVLPRVHKFFLVAGKKLDDLLGFTYRLLRYRYADELFLLNGAALASVLADNAKDIGALRGQLPPWVVVVGIAGREELPEERVAYQLKDITDIAQEFGLKLAESVPGAEAARVGELVNSPSREPYWKLGYKGGSQEIFFLTTLDEVSKLSPAMFAAAEKAGCPAEDIGIYLQPRQQGVNCHCEFMLPYNPGDAAETARLQDLYAKASAELINQGAFFSRPYGIWADMAFARDAQTTKVLKNIKSTFDPNGVLNPGKLCFKVN